MPESVTRRSSLVATRECYALRNRRRPRAVHTARETSVSREGRMGFRGLMAALGVLLAGPATAAAGSGRVAWSTSSALESVAVAASDGQGVVRPLRGLDPAWS